MGFSLLMSICCILYHFWDVRRILLPPPRQFRTPLATARPLATLLNTMGSAPMVKKSLAPSPSSHISAPYNAPQCYLSVQSSSPFQFLPAYLSTICWQSQHSTANSPPRITSHPLNHQTPAPHCTSQQLNHHYSTNPATQSELTLLRRRQHPPAIPSPSIAHQPTHATSTRITLTHTFSSQQQSCSR